MLPESISDIVLRKSDKRDIAYMLCLKRFHSLYHHGFSYSMIAVVLCNTHMVKSPSSPIMPAQNTPDNHSIVLSHNTCCRIPLKKNINTFSRIINRTYCKSLNRKPQAADTIIVSYSHGSYNDTHYLASIYF